jgi:restriction endonuclease Mrr
MLCAACSLGFSWVSSGWAAFGVFVIMLASLGVVIYLIWQLVTDTRVRSAHEQAAQQEYDAYVAQQQYAAYVAQQQQYAAYATYAAQQQYQHQDYTAYKQHAAQQEAEEEQQTEEELEDKEFLEHISALVGLLSLSPSDFKRAVLLLFESWGYPEIKQPDGADLAVDFICRDERGDVTAVQCKRYEPDMPVDDAEIQRFIDVTADHHIQHWVFVTTSSFTEPALALGHEHDIQMIGGEELVGLMQEFRAAMEE